MAIFSPSTILGIVIFIPAITALYYFLGEFEGYFKANKALFMVLFGLGLGMIIGFSSLLFDFSNLLEALGIIALVEVVKFFILLQKPFRLNRDTPFYGFALGTGISSMMIYVYSFAAGLVSLDIFGMGFFFLVSYNYTFINASTGAIIGKGSKLGEFWIYLARAFLLSGLHGIMMLFVWSYQFGEIGAFAFLAMGAVYGTYLIMHVYKDIFPESIPENVEEAEEEEQSG